MQIWEKRAGRLAGWYEWYDQYEQRQSFGWLAFISCPADMRTVDTLETRDAAGARRCNVATWCSSGSSNRQEDGCDGIGTPRGQLLSGLKNGLVFHLPLSLYLPPSSSLCPLLPLSFSLSFHLPFSATSPFLLHPTPANNSWDRKSPS